MKKIYLLLLAAASFTLVNATTHIVQVANFQFTPSTLNVQVGDVVTFQWVSGSHTTTCDPTALPGTSLPAGAAAWDSDIKSTLTSFSVTITTPGEYVYGCVPHFAFGMQGTITASAIVTPVKLSDFTVVTQNDKAKLVWKTASEQNADYFSVRKSVNGKDFTEAGKVTAAGNSNEERTYSFSDNLSGTKAKFVYYELATVDKDGKQELSKILIAKNPVGVAQLITSLSPNPIPRPGHLMLTFNAEAAGTMQVQVVDMQGKKVIETTMAAVEGVNNGHLHMGDLPTGTYNILFSLAGTTETKKVVVK